MVTGLQLDLAAGHRRRNRLLGLRDPAAEILGVDIDIQITRQLGILGTDTRWPRLQAQRHQATERDQPATGGRHQHLARNRLRAVAQLARVAQRDAVTLPPFDRGGDALATQCARNHLLYRLHAQAIARHRLAIRLQGQEVAARQALGIGATHPGQRLDHLLDLPRQLVDSGQIRAEHLDTDRGTNTSGEHVDAGTDRHGPGIGNAR